MKQDVNKGGADVPPAAWDPLVRITHWSIAVGVIANKFIDEAGGVVHVWIGWAVMGLLAIRLAWGVFGTAEARFSAFPPSPRAALAHLRRLLGGKPPEYQSHNPAGAMMIYALWATLSVVIISGLVMTGGRSPITIAKEKAAVTAGDWSGMAANVHNDEAEDGKKNVANRVHGISTNLLFILSVVHVLGVAAESRALRRNLVRPMIGGRNRGS